MKNARQAEILNIVQTTEVETQEQLLSALKAKGFTATQATVSRDIKELRLVKELTGQGKYRYAATDRKNSAGTDTRLRNIFKEGVTSVDVAGLASAACSALDGMDIPGMVGSLAGDDTGILIMRDNGAAQKFSSEVHKLLT